MIFFIDVHAQNVSIQVSPGLMNYGGDLQNKGYTFQNANLSISGSLIYTINKFSIKGSLTYGNVGGNDSGSTKFKFRNLSFRSKIYEAGLCVQYDFLKLDDNHKFTPYLFAGYGLFHFNPYTFYDSKKYYLQGMGTEGEGLAMYPDRKIYSLTQSAIPIGIGIKYKLSDNIFLGIEFCSRLLFTDYLDDVSKTYPNETALFNARGQRAVDLSFRGNEIDPNKPFPSGATRGNPDQNDNYYTSSFSFIYMFSSGSHSSYYSGSHKKTKSVDCPKNVQ
jgi:opacity protein-like surface antigen